MPVGVQDHGWTGIQCNVKFLPTLHTSLCGFTYVGVNLTAFDMARQNGQHSQHRGAASAAHGERDMQHNPTLPLRRTSHISLAIYLYALSYWIKFFYGWYFDVLKGRIIYTATNPLWLYDNDNKKSQCKETSFLIHVNQSIQSGHVTPLHSGWGSIRRPSSVLSRRQVMPTLIDSFIIMTQSPTILCITKKKQ